MSNPYAGLTGYELQHLPSHLGSATCWDELECLLTDLFFLEAKAEAGLVFGLAEDFGAAGDGLPADRPLFRLLFLLAEALRRDIHFIARHPSTLFQCFWNACWWFDCPERANHDEPAGGSRRQEQQSTSSRLSGRTEPLHRLLEAWRAAKEESRPGFVWLRSLRPPPVQLGAGQWMNLRGHEKWVNGVAFSPDGRRVASGSGDKTVRVWDAVGGRELVVIRGHEQGVVGLSFSPDGERIVGACWGGTVRVWDARSGRERMVLPGHRPGVASAAYSPDGRRLVSAGSDNTVRVWDADSGQELAVLRGHEDHVNSAAFSPDGRWVVSGSSDRTVRVWDVDRRQEVAVLRGHEATVSSVCFSPDGRRIVSAGSWDKTVRVWDVATGNLAAAHRGPKDDEIHAVSCSPDGRYIAAATGCMEASAGLQTERAVVVWDVMNGREVATLRGHEGEVLCVCYSPDSRRIVSGSKDGTVRIWGPTTAESPAVLRGHKDTIGQVLCTPDGRHVVSVDKSVFLKPSRAYVWDADNGRLLATLLESRDPLPIKACATSDARYLVSTHLVEPRLRVWDVARGRLVATARAAPSTVYSVNCSPGRKRIVACFDDHTARVYDLETGREVLVFRGHEGKVTAVLFSPDGRRVISGSSDRTVRVWDADTGRHLMMPIDVRGEVSAVAVSPDGKRLAVSSSDREVGVWEVEGGRLTAVLSGHKGTVEALAFSPDGKRLITGSQDSTVRAWDVETRQCLQVIAGRADVDAVAAGPSAFPFRAVASGAETFVEPADAGTPVAWFPHSLENVITHPGGYTWIGPIGHHLHFIHLERGGRRFDNRQ